MLPLMCAPRARVSAALKAPRRFVEAVEGSFELSTIVAAVSSNGGIDRDRRAVRSSRQKMSRLTYVADDYLQQIVFHPVSATETGLLGRRAWPASRSAPTRHRARVP